MRNFLKIKRWESGIKQYELAILLGCSSTYLSMVENGRIEPTERFKIKVSEIFNLPVEE
ncbi:MAG: XRE family transcriptional regulator, partial [Calditrichaeota bacterium]